MLIANMVLYNCLAYLEIYHLGQLYKYCIHWLRILAIDTYGEL